MQHFDAQNSKKESKNKQTFSLQRFETHATSQKFCKIKEQNLIFTQKTHSLASKYFIENMKLKFPTMNCNFKTNPASMHTHTVNFSFLLGWGVWN